MLASQNVPLTVRAKPGKPGQWQAVDDFNIAVFTGNKRDVEKYAAGNRDVRRAMEAKRRLI